jgi:phosphatidylinositol alpha 1,6-mannosyltransferase
MELLRRHLTHHRRPLDNLHPLPTRGAPGPGTDDRLRVLVVAESFLPQVNGVTNSVRRVLEHLSAEHHHAELVAPTGPATYAGFPVTRARGANLPFYADFRLGMESRRRLRGVMERFQPDVVHLASPATLGHQAARAAQDLAIPTVAIYQTDLVGFAEQYAVPGGRPAMARLTRRVHAGVDRTLAPSTASLEQLRRLRVGGLALWPRGVDTVQFDPAKRSEALRRRIAPAGELVVGYVGRLAAEKELHLLREVQDLPGVRLVLVGGGPDEARLRAELPRARFLGVLHGGELAAAYASLDVFVHTGRHETFCQSAQEALASGVPVVAPDAGGPRDLVHSGRNGFRYPAGDGRALTAYVRALQHDDLLRRRLAAQARPSVAGRTWTAVNEALVEHYRDVVGVGRGGRRGVA